MSAFVLLVLKTLPSMGEMIVDKSQGIVNRPSKGRTGQPKSIWKFSTTMYDPNWVGMIGFNFFL